MNALKYFKRNTLLDLNIKDFTIKSKVQYLDEVDENYLVYVQEDNNYYINFENQWILLGKGKI